MIEILIFLLILIYKTNSCVIISLNNSNNTYLLCNETIKLIPDKYTENLLLNYFTQSNSIYSLNQFIVDHPIHSLIEYNTTSTINKVLYGHLTNISIYEIVNGFKRLMNDIYKIPQPCYNPSIALYNESYHLIFCRSTNIDMSLMKYGFINKKSLTLQSNYSLLLYNETLGEDFRSLRINTTSYLISCTYVSNHHLRIKQFYFHINNDMISISNVIHLFPYDQSRSHHKNWCSFIYSNRILYIVTINPLHVIENIPSVNETNLRININQEIVANNTYVLTKTYSITRYIKINWKYGELRGGTPAQLLDQSTYLSFFHSSLRLNKFFNTSITYFIGAYTFTSTHPFKLLAVSQVPIVTKALYNGSWSMWKRRWKTIDYIVFPMSFIYLNDSMSRLQYNICDDRCLKTQDVLLSFGWQDQYAMLTRFNLYDLMKSLQRL